MVVTLRWGVGHLLTSTIGWRCQRVELIDHEPSAWRYELIKVFAPNPVREILSVSLGEINGADFLICQPSKDVEFRVKPAYYLSQRLNNNWLDSNLPSSSSVWDGKWDKIWDAKSQSKIKSLCWSPCHDALPTRVSPTKRDLDVDVFTLVVCMLMKPWLTFFLGLHTSDKGLVAEPSTSWHKTTCSRF